MSAKRGGRRRRSRKLPWLESVPPVVVGYPQHQTKQRRNRYARRAVPIGVRCERCRWAGEACLFVRHVCREDRR